MRPAVAALFVVLALQMSVSCGQTAGDNQSPLDGFRKFWSDFRQAALAGNREKVASMTGFPFRTRGPLDSDPVKTYDRASFLGILDKLLEQDSGLGRQPETMRRFIERTATVTDKMLGDGGATARVGAFSFQRMGGLWRFTSAYVDE